MKKDSIKLSETGVAAEGEGVSIIRSLLATPGAISEVGRVSDVSAYGTDCVT
jgi:hypothetical protein